MEGLNGSGFDECSSARAKSERTYASRVCTVTLIAKGTLTHYFAIDVAATGLSQPGVSSDKKTLGALGAEIGRVRPNDLAQNSKKTRNDGG